VVEGRVAMSFSRVAAWKRLSVAVALRRPFNFLLASLAGDWVKCGRLQLTVVYSCHSSAIYSPAVAVGESGASA